MSRFWIARLLGFVLTVTVMTGCIALPAMAAEEVSAAAGAAQETDGAAGGSAQESGREEETVPEASEQTALEETTSEETISEDSASEETTSEEAGSGQTGSEETSAQEKSEAAEEAQADTDTEEAAVEEEAEDTDHENEEGEGTLSVSDAETASLEGGVDVRAIAADAADVTATGKFSKEGEQDTGVQSCDAELSASTAEITVGTTDSLTVKITLTAGSEEAFDAAAAAAVDGLVWATDGSGAASIAEIGEADIQKSGGASGSADGEEAAGSEEEPVVFSGVISQTATIKGLEEGETCVTVTAAEKSCNCKVTVKPVCVQLGKTANLCWRDTTVLTWDKVSNAGKYKVVVSVCEGTTSYAGVLTVTTNSCDLEDKIVALIRAHRSSLTGASYSVKATVRAISTDPVHYSDGEAVSAPGIRYLKTTYEEALSRNGWFEKGGEWYFYEAGVKQTGWFYFNGKVYYLYSDGRMAHDCWIGVRYLKSNGERACGEWVDNYKYYVDSSGKRVDNAIFRSGNFVKTTKGWRYVRTNGKADFKNRWVSIYNRMYYFDANGYIKTGFFTVNGNRYFTNYTGTLETGLGVRRTGWVDVGSGSYWLDDNGIMLKSQWVDKKQYYVDAYGHRIDWISYNNLRNVNTSNRLGYYIYNSNSAPEQSIAGYEAAYKKGNRIMVIDLRFTKDNVPVCFHDDVIKYARNKDGSEPGTKPSVSKSTLSQLNRYDYGIKWGSSYKGTGALTLDAMAKWIAAHPDTELYIEVKADTMNATQISKAVSVLGKYGVVNNASMIFTPSSTSDTRAQRVHNAAPTLRIGITTPSVNSLAIDQIKKVKGANNEVFLWCWDSTALSAAKIKTLRSLNVQYECGTFSTLNEVLSYYAKGNVYVYNSGVETDGAVFHQLLRAATMHEKAKWVKTSQGWKYQYASGNYARSKWVTISGKNYYFTSNAIMKTGWLSQGGKLYYLKSDGAMATGNTTIGGHVYQFAANGVFVKKIK